MNVRKSFHIDLFVGIDVCSKKLDVCFLYFKKDALNESSLGNNIVVANTIKDNILLYNQQKQYNQINIDLKPTSVYSFRPAMFLHKDKELKTLNLT